MYIRRKRKGFTLIELLAVVSIITIVMSAIFMVMSSGVMSYFSGVKKQNAVHNARQTMVELSNAIKNSRDYYIIRDSDTRFKASVDQIDETNSNEKRLLFVVTNESKDDNDNNNIAYIYYLKKVYDDSGNFNGSYELRKKQLTTGKRKYNLPNSYVREAITAEESDIYNNSDIIRKKDRVEKNNRVLYDNKVLADFPSGYSEVNAYLLYENNGLDCYLWATSNDNNLDYKIKLEPKSFDEADFTLVPNSSVKAAEYLSSVTLQDSDTPSNTDNCDKCSIAIKTTDKNSVIDKEREITTVIYKLNQRGDFR